ncbi:MAG: tRNA dimethylallyltransferase [Syntrophus sp. PtaU1.Bin005]|nr:MAG: tRNA dimethylallyltransferase [Syntrophus sp. PtaU1.Bin005]
MHGSGQDNMIREQEKPRLIVVMGPTAAGKTRTAIALAEFCNGEIVSADSMQVYRHMDIGTAKPTPAEQGQVRHHLIDIVNPDEPFSAASFMERARAAITDLHRRGKGIVVTGGTGLYIRALLGGLFDGPGADEALRRSYAAILEREGKPGLYEILKTKDSRAAAIIHPNDVARTVRALEVLELTGVSIVDQQQDHGFAQRPYSVLKIGLRMERPRLYERIEARTDQMMALGFLEEVQGLLDMGFSGDLKPMQALGYRQLVRVLKGTLGLEEAVTSIKRETRRYAKRQLTWFGADPEISWFDAGDREGILQSARRLLERNPTSRSPLQSGGTLQNPLT